MKRQVLTFSLLLESGVLASGVHAQPVGYSRLVVNGSAAPEGRIDGVVGFDVPGRQFFLFGGDGTRTLNDLWSYSLQTGQWRRVEADGAPAPRFGHTLVFDGRRRRLVVFGGQAGGFFNDTWAFDIAAGRWSQLDAGSGPSKRYGHSAIYDASRDRMVVSHGFTDAGRFDDTWSYDFATSRWSDLRPSNRPLRRCLHHAVYDSANDQMLLYGGCASGTPMPNNCPLDDLWSLPLGGNTWRELGASPRPRGRQWYGTAFDGTRRRMVVFGGTGGGDLNDTWEFDPGARQWSQASPVGEVPSARSRHEGVYVEELGGVVFFGGRVGAQATNELWLYGGPYTPPGAVGEKLPTISDNGVVGAFSGRALPLAPGKNVSMFGDFGVERPVTTSLDPATLRLPTMASDVYVTFNGIRAPLFHVQGDQVNAQVPYELASTDGAVEVRVGYQGRLGGASRARLQATSPELFATAFHADGTPVSTERPASAAEVLIFFATGQGLTSPASATGVAAAGVLPDPVAETRLRVGGFDAEILFRGQAPGTVGVMQVNARLSADVASGVALVNLEVGETVSPGIVIPVR